MTKTSYGALRDPKTDGGRAPWWPLLLIWLLALALRAGLAATERVVWGDEPFYLWLGRNWVLGEGYAFVGMPDVHHGPLFPMIAGLVYKLTSDLQLASEILYVILGAALVLPVYAMGREIYGRRVGLIASALTAVLPALTVSILHWGTMTEPTYLLVLYTGLWAGLLMCRPLWQSRGPKSEGAPWWAGGLTGLCLGLAYLTRPEAINYVFVIGVYFLALSVTRAYIRCRGFWTSTALFALAFAASFVPYAYYISVHTGSWMVSEKIGIAYLTGIGLAFGDTAAFDRATWGLDSLGLETFFFSPESYSVSMLDLVLGSPKTFLTVLYLNVQTFLRVLIDATLFPYFLLPLAFLGLFYRGWGRMRTLMEGYLVLTFLPVLGFVLFFIQARYLVPIVPVLILWSSVGLSQISDWLVGTIVSLRSPTSVEQLDPADGSHLVGWVRNAIAVAPAALTLILLLASYPDVVDSVTNVGSFRTEHRLLGEHLSADLPEDTVVMSRYPALAFHANTRWVPTPNASVDEVLDYARRKGVDLFVIDDRELRYRPQFGALLADPGSHEVLKAVDVPPAVSEGLTVFRLVHSP